MWQVRFLYTQHGSRHALKAIVAWSLVVVSSTIVSFILGKKTRKYIIMASVNSPLSSILKTSRLSGTNSKKVASPMQVRFDAQTWIDVVKILEDHIEGRHNMYYTKLLDMKINPVPVMFLLLF